MVDTVLETVLRRDRTLVAIGLLAMTALAWAWLLWSAQAMPMQGSDPMHMPAMGGTHGPWGAPEFGFNFLMWAIMMVAMMVPSAAPMILLYARVGRQAAACDKPFAATGYFLAGYIAVWIGFSLLASLAQWQLTDLKLLDRMMTSGSPALSGALLLVAGVFQWSHLKDQCLAQCQSPLQFIQRHGGFRGTPQGAFGIGLRHGLYCLGCCWALMALLFVGGVMNLFWIAALSAFVIAEKMLVGQQWFRFASGTLLSAAGIALLIGHAQ